MSFKVDIEKLFDVSPANLLECLKSSRKPEWEEDWLWYQGMCKVPQVGCMTTRDASLAMDIANVPGVPVAEEAEASGDTVLKRSATTVASHSALACAAAWRSSRRCLREARLASRVVIQPT